MNAVPVKSIVRVAFPDRGAAYAYYNDQFDLREGDFVYVEGKLEGARGIVIEVNRNFKIRLSDYKRVIGRADTAVSGSFQLAGKYLIALDRGALPYEKAITWFKAPKKPEDEYVSGSDGAAFALSRLKSVPFPEGAVARGEAYYEGNRVVYLEVDNGRGRAIVAGTAFYELAFAFDGTRVGSLTCDCYVTALCKHEYAAMLALREILKRVPENAEYFAAIERNAFFDCALSENAKGEIAFSIRVK